MKKFTDTIIEKRNYILVLFIILSLICIVLIGKVKINYDMAEYLPSTSKTRIGMNIMEKEFDNSESSNLNIMFKDLKEREKEKIKKNLEKIKGVSEVKHDNSKEYNKKNYSLYTIIVDHADDSKIAKSVYKEVKDEYKDYDIAISGSIAERNKTVLPPWIMIVAISCATVILIIMSTSYVEPFLFLTAIFIAILLNMGTNIIFSNVSNITNSITAILQMALSMDYSIMLMNRYNQEKQHEKDKIKAMKKALYNAFQSISSSSITTIVGLLALVFMSFTIGRDLGFVLAKGVLFSLVSIFFVLPGLILIFDNLITKTKKKSLTLKLNKLGQFSYKNRYFALGLICFVFVLAYLFKGNLGILYTDSESDEVKDIFKENNQMAIIYNNKYEDEVKKYCKQLSTDNKTDQVLCYGNTIGEDLTYNNLNKKLNDLGSDVEVENYLLQIIYYKYYNKNETSSMSMNDFINFIQDKIYTNDKINSKLDNNIKNNITTLTNFTTTDNINKLRTTNEIASILDMDQSSIDALMIYYDSLHTNTKIDLNTFTSFILTDVLNNPTYSNNLDNSSKEKIQTLSKFTNKTIITNKMNSNQMASILETTTNDITNLYNYYVMINNPNQTLSINQFSNFVLNNILTNHQYENLFDTNTKSKIQLLKNYSDKNIINKQMTSQEIATTLGISQESTIKLFLLYYSNIDTGSKLSLTEKLDKTTLALIFNNISNGLVDKVYSTLNLNDNVSLSIQEFITIVAEKISPALDENNQTVINNLKNTIDSSIVSNKTEYSAIELANLLNTNYQNIIKLYALINYNKGNTNNWTMSLNDFITLIINNSSNPQISNIIDSNTLNNLNLLKTIMDSTNNNKTYTYNELSQLIEVDSNNLKSIYTLYNINNNNISLTPYEFVNFILNHQNDSMLKNNLSSSTINNLKLANTIMTSTLNNTKYSYNELANLFSMNTNNIKLLYGLYDSKYLKSNQAISLKNFTDFLITNVLTNTTYSSNINNNSKNKLIAINSIMNDSINNTKYTKEELYTKLSLLSNNLDKKLIELMYIYHSSIYNYNNNYTLSVEKLINYLNNDILKDDLFKEFIDKDMKKNIKNAQKTINDAKKMLVGKNYSRVIINTKLDPESKETFSFLKKIQDKLATNNNKIYVIGNSPMAYEISKTFSNEMDFITILTMISIFIVVAITFKSLLIPLVLTLIIQCAVYITMAILSLLGGKVYFISLLIVQSILMGATIDYAILYTSYYLELRNSMNTKNAVINAYNKSIHTILTSSSILIIVTLIVGSFASAIAAKICRTISQGTFCSLMLILFILPAILASLDKFIYKNK